MNPQIISQDRQSARIAAVSSIVLHVLLLLLCMLSKIGELPKPAEWIEISLAAGQSLSPPRSAGAAEREVVATPAEALAQSRESAPAPEAGRQEAPLSTPAGQQRAPAEPVKANLPQRRMMEEENVELPVQTGEKLDAPNNALEGEKVTPLEGRENSRDVGKGESPSGIAKNQDSGDSLGAALAADHRGEGLDTPFSIEGEAANRVVLYRVIPEFPEGARRSAAVRIRFTVLADGRVGSAVLMQKGEARLEKVALDAFRQWRFNALASSARNRIEQGVITFRFLLK